MTPAIAVSNNRAQLTWACVCGMSNTLSRETCMNCEGKRPNAPVSLGFCLWVQASFDELMGADEIFPSKSPLHQHAPQWVIPRMEGALP